MRFEIELPRRERPLLYCVQRQRVGRAIADRAASELHRYFKFRARHQGVPSLIPETWFHDRLTHGHRSFFGVLVDDHGVIAEDTQRPDCLRAFRRAADSLKSLLG